MSYIDNCYNKVKLLESVKLCFPKFYKLNINSYVEPFCGMCNNYFYLRNNVIKFNKVILNDVNKDLINLHLELKDNYELLYEKLNNLIYNFEKCSTINNKIDYYNEVKALFNKTRSSHYYLFLLCLCYEKLIRVNSKNEFNVSFDKSIVKYNFPSNNDLLKHSILFENCTLLDKDFESTLNYIDENTFVYIDPPYKHSNFSDYRKYNLPHFEDKDYDRLLNYCLELSKRNTKFLMVGIDIPFIREKFSKYYMEDITYYNISNKKSDRIRTILYYNYL